MKDYLKQWVRMNYKKLFSSGNYIFCYKWTTSDHLGLATLEFLYEKETNKLVPFRFYRFMFELN